MNIEISYAIMASVIAIIIMLTVTHKMSLGIGIIGTLLGFGIVFLLAPYTQIVIKPVGDAIIYGGAWSTAAILGVIHLGSLIAMTIIAALNLLKSEGKIIWA